MTNFERLKAMAENITDMIDNQCRESDCGQFKNCDDCRKLWLESEVSGNG